MNALRPPILLLQPATCFLLFVVLSSIAGGHLIVQAEDRQMVDSHVIDCLYAGCIDTVFKSPTRALQCLEDKSVLKCLVQNMREELRTNRTNFPYNSTAEALEDYKKTLSGKLTKQLNALKKKAFLNVPKEFKLKILPEKNGAYDLTLNYSVNSDGGDNAVSERKMKFKMSDMLPFLVVPPLIMTGLMPFIIPSLKMAVMFAGMINNMALSSALFTFMRGYIFESGPASNIVYVNSGYKNDRPKLPPHPPQPQQPQQPQHPQLQGQNQQEYPSLFTQPQQFPNSQYPYPASNQPHRRRDPYKYPR